MNRALLAGVLTCAALLASCSGESRGGTVAHNALLLGDVQVSSAPVVVGPGDLPEMQKWQGLADAVAALALDPGGSVEWTNNAGSYPSVLVRGTVKNSPVLASIIWDSVQRRRLNSDEVIAADKLDDAVAAVALGLRNVGQKADFENVPLAEKWKLVRALTPSTDGTLRILVDGCSQGDCAQPTRSVNLSSTLAESLMTKVGVTWWREGLKAAPSLKERAEAQSASSHSAVAPPPDASTPPEPGAKVDCAALKCVALTFDDGPGPYTGTLLDSLRQLKVRASFFVIGRNFGQSGRALMKRMVAEGHEVGNHTWNHLDLARQNVGVQQTEMNDTSAEIQKIIGKRPELFRPPYGSFHRGMKTNDMSIILWDVDTLDWKHKDPATTLAYVRRQTKPGSIILMHDVHQASVQAVPSVVAYLRSKGYTLVTLQQLLGRTTPSRVYSSQNG